MADGPDGPDGCFRKLGGNKNYFAGPDVQEEKVPAAGAGKKPIRPNSPKQPAGPSGPSDDVCNEASGPRKQGDTIRTVRMVVSGLSMGTTILRRPSPVLLDEKTVGGERNNPLRLLLSGTTVRTVRRRMSKVHP